MDNESVAAVNGMSNRELLDGAVDLRWSIERMEARLLEQLAEIDRRRAFEEDGAVTAVAWLRSKCRLDAGRAGQLVRLARSGESWPEVRDAQLQGRISGCEAYRIAQGADTYRRDLQRHGSPEPAAAREVDELRHTLLDSAVRGEGSNTLRRTIDSYRHQLVADSMVFDEWTAFQQRELHFYTTFGGMVEVRGTLDPSTAATVRGAVEALNRPAGASNDLTAGQRRADALVQLARNALDHGALPGSGQQKPHVTVTVSEQTLRTGPSDAGASPAELRGHGSSSGETARLFACDGEITRLIDDPTSTTLDVGRATRVVPKALRKALDARDSGCAYPQCDRPVEWCDAHHIQHWARGGRTDLDNLALLCRRHHTEVHLKGILLEWRNGTLSIGDSSEARESSEKARGSRDEEIDTRWSR